MLLCGMLIAGSAFGSASSILVSGQSDLAIIDGDGDGPDSGDCRFQATVASPGNGLSITATQDTTIPLRACAGSYSGSVFTGTDESSAFAGATIDSSEVGAGDLPIVAELVDEEPPPESLPAGMDDLLDGVAIHNTISEEQIGAGFLCNAGGPAAQVTLRNGTSLLRSLALFPDAQNPTHLRVPDVPLE